MSWICQSLIRNSISIKTNPDLNSDEYNNLLTMEGKIKELHERGFLSDLDMFIIELASDGRSMSELAFAMGRADAKISATFIQICERISYFLGGYFTDEGFLDSMKTDYRLSDEQIEKLRKHIKGKFKHTLIKSTTYLETL